MNLKPSLLAMEVMSLIIFLAVWYPGAALPPTMIVLATNGVLGLAFSPKRGKKKEEENGF